MVCGFRGFWVNNLFLLATLACFSVTSALPVHAAQIGVNEVLLAAKLKKSIKKFMSHENSGDIRGMINSMLSVKSQIEPFPSPV